MIDMIPILRGFFIVSFFLLIFIIIVGGLSIGLYFKNKKIEKLEQTIEQQNNEIYAMTKYLEKKEKIYEKYEKMQPKEKEELSKQLSADIDYLFEFWLSNHPTKEYMESSSKTGTPQNK